MWRCVAWTIQSALMRFWRQVVHLGMGDSADLIGVIRAVDRRGARGGSEMIALLPELVAARVAREQEFFLSECSAQVYEGDTLLHVASFAYDSALARRLVELGADVRARNRRGGEPLHAATIGGPGSSSWDPHQQCEIIVFLVSVRSSGAIVSASLPRSRFGVVQRSGGPGRRRPRCRCFIAFVVAVGRIVEITRASSRLLPIWPKGASQDWPVSKG
jgi:hypothetical protein